MKNRNDSQLPLIGIGLRHPHFDEALGTPAEIDFVEVHSENFFAKGGALHAQLDEIAQTYPVSLHSTAMGLGSACGIPEFYLKQLASLVDLINPILLSDHASFSWGNIQDIPVHGGDLLPLIYNQNSLDIMISHVKQVQQYFGRSILVENLSAYLALPGSEMTEQQFLVRLSKATNCGLLVDLNNILVNAFNSGCNNPLQAGIAWIKDIPIGMIGEIHLAGFTAPSEGEIAVDDHASEVSQTCWSLYAETLKHHGPIPTLIEWDNNLPDWKVLVKQSELARKVAHEALGYE